NSPRHFPLRRTSCVPWFGLRFRWKPFSMMGEARYNGTNITWRKAVKFMLFRCEIELKDASIPLSDSYYWSDGGFQYQNWSIQQCCNRVLFLYCVTSDPLIRASCIVMPA